MNSDVPECIFGTADNVCSELLMPEANNSV